jgi:hypothetical protein
VFDAAGPVTRVVSFSSFVPPMLYLSQCQSE